MNDCYLELLEARSRLWGLYRSWYVPANTRRRIVRDVSDIQQRSGLSLEQICEYTGLDYARCLRWSADAARADARHAQLLGYAARWREFLGSTWFSIVAPLLTVVGAYLCIRYIDIPVATYFYGLRETSLYETFVNISYLGESSFYLLFFALFWWVTRRRDGRTASISLYVFLSILYSGIIVNFFKLLFGRARPELLFSAEKIHGFTLFNFKFSEFMHQSMSFPSGHSATAFSLGLSLSLLFPRYRLLFMSSALLIALSRVVVFMHFPADVLTGALIGIMIPVWLYSRMYGERRAGQLLES
ncbi:MAG: phosphatase PAP2 family protein [Spirochaetales bacterium]|nr:phosphatase PAP2 family protein [Spirochaetales bacterium]